MNSKIFIAFIFFVSAYSSLFSLETIEDKFKNTVVQVKITTQSPNFLFPWQPKKPQTSGAVGVVLANKRILVFTSLIDYYTSIEVKKFSSYTSVPATVIKMDYESNLSVLEVSDPDFFKDLVPIQFETKIEPFKPVSILQLDNSGSIQNSKGRLTGIDMENYPMGYTELPYLHVNSNEKLDGNGELILDNDKAVGVLYRFTASKNSGKAIPSFVINTFIKQKFEKTKGTVFPFKGFRFRPIPDETTKEYFGLDKKTDGVLVAEVIPNSSADKYLQLNDIILEYGGMKIDSQGYFKHPVYGKQYISFLAHSGEEFGFKMGSKIPVKILRNKKEETISIPLKAFPYKSVKIPYMNNEGKEPEYLIKGGFIFAELSEFLMKEFGTSWRSRIDKKLLYLNDYYRMNKKGDTGRYVLLVQVLPDDSNNGYHSLSFEIIKTVNGKPLKSIRELDAALNEGSSLESGEGKFLSLQTENGSEIVLDKSTLKEIDAKIQKKFGIERLKNF